MPAPGWGRGRPAPTQTVSWAFSAALPTVERGDTAVCGGAAEQPVDGWPVAWADPEPVGRRHLDREDPHLVAVGGPQLGHGGADVDAELGGWVRPPADLLALHVVGEQVPTALPVAALPGEQHPQATPADIAVR